MDVTELDNREQSDLLDIGVLLCEARDNLGLSTADIAKELNLANDIVIKIERNQFDQDIPAAFIRGYVQSYATRVGLDTDPILQQFDQLSGIELPSLKRVPAISSFGKKRREINSSNYLFKTISILMILLFLSFAAWEVWKRYFSIQDLANEQNLDISAELNINDEGNKILLDSEQHTLEQVENQPLENNQEVLNTTQVDLSSVTSDASIEKASSDISDSDNEKSNVIIAESSPILEPLISIDTSIMTSLILDFSDDCWVKIVDAHGTVIAEGVKNAGKHMPVEGVAPFDVILGNPSVVTMNYAGRDYDLSSYQTGRRAHIILN